jgi:hypothetical protein
MREQFVDLVDGMIVEAGGDITQPFPGIYIVYFAGSDETIDFCKPLRSLVSSAE